MRRHWSIIVAALLWLLTTLACENGSAFDRQLAGPPVCRTPTTCTCPVGSYLDAFDRLCYHATANH